MTHVKFSIMKRLLGLLAYSWSKNSCEVAKESCDSVLHQEYADSYFNDLAREFYPKEDSFNA